ncbi:MAG: acetate--CoA ligase family protein [Sphingomonadaceae bacterium]|nr:acetate--CoA ligase family protein [Sphingomonadaceae bacterium]
MESGILGSTRAGNHQGASKGSLEALLAPRSVAIFGASEDATRIGGRTLANLVNGGFAGPIYPINPTRPTVQGYAAFATLAEAPGPVDCAVLAVPAEAVLPAIEDCARHRVRGAVIFSAGFAEAGGAGEDRQARLKALTQAAGIRVVGPNCLGLYRNASRTWLSFTALFQPPTEGATIGMASQSGGSASHLLKLAQMRGLVVGTSITTGNEMDVDIGEVLEMLAADPATSLIMLYIEGARRRGSLERGLALARINRKPVIALKVGRTQQGARAAASHTAALAGDDRLYDALFRAHGVHRAATNEEMLDIAHAVSRSPMPSGRRLGVVTISGGMGAQIADLASDADLILPPLDATTQNRLHALCPPGSPGNPVDITAQLSTDPELLTASIRLVLESGAVDVCLAFFGVYAGVPALDATFRRDLERLRADHPRAVIMLCVVCPPEVAAAYEAMGFLTFEEPARAVRVIGALASFAAAFDARSTNPAGPDAGPTIGAGERFDESAAKALLGKVGIASPAERAVADAAGAYAAAAGMRLPVALKVRSADILHKSDVGGVALGLASAQAVGATAEAMLATVARARPDAMIEGLLVAEMVGGGVDLLLGARSDPLFGPYVLVGFGGVATELFEDVALRLAPLDRETARSMIAGLRCHPLLAGFRGAPRLDIDAAVDALFALSTLIAANAGTVATIEINPLRVLEKGALALDAVIETQPKERQP